MAVVFEAALDHKGVTAAMAQLRRRAEAIRSAGDILGGLVRRGSSAQDVLGSVTSVSGSAGLTLDPAGYLATLRRKLRSPRFKI